MYVVEVTTKMSFASQNTVTKTMFTDLQFSKRSIFGVKKHYL